MAIGRDLWRYPDAWSTAAGASDPDRWGYSDFKKRSIAVSFGFVWGTDVPLNEMLSALWGTDAPLDETLSAAWGSDVPLDETLSAVWGTDAPMDETLSAAWNAAAGTDALGKMAWDSGVAEDSERRILWGENAASDAAFNCLWQTGVPRDRRFGISMNFAACDAWAGGGWETDAWQCVEYRVIPVERTRQTQWAQGVPAADEWRVRWGRGRPCDRILRGLTGWYISPYPTFKVRWRGEFVQPKRVSARWISRVVFMIQHDFYCKRVADNQTIRVVSGSISSDIDSWARSVNLTLASREDLEALRFDALAPQHPGMVEIEIGISGHKWRFLIREIRADLKYNSAGFTASGVSISYRMHDPYYVSPASKTYVNPISLVQILYDRIQSERDGFLLDFPDTDWMDRIDCSLPGNLYSFSEKTPVQVVGEIIREVGGSMQSHTWEPKIILQSRFPHSPKEWEFIADRPLIGVQQLISEAVNQRSAPKYNKILVSGKLTGGIEAGYAAWVQREASMGDKYAPEVVSLFVQDFNTCRERGRVELDSAGYDQLEYALTYPLFPADSLTTPGLLTPLQIVSVSDLFETFDAQIERHELTFGDSGIWQKVTAGRYL